tara:strand:+ start:130 stop:378 length:249 start_codon:yes stop_codon:yes gene_type:complete
MEYVLLDSTNEVVGTIDSVTPGGAKHYFIERKKIDEESFDKLWKVMTKKEYKLNEEAFMRKPSSEGMDWWKDEEDYLDLDKL